MTKEIVIKLLIGFNKYAKNIIPFGIGMFFELNKPTFASSKFKISATYNVDTPTTCHEGVNDQKYLYKPRKIITNM